MDLTPVCGPLPNVYECPFDVFKASMITRATVPNSVLSYCNVRSIYNQEKFQHPYNYQISKAEAAYVLGGQPYEQVMPDPVTFTTPMAIMGALLLGIILLLALLFIRYKSVSSHSDERFQPFENDAQ